MNLASENCNAKEIKPTQKSQVPHHVYKFQAGDHARGLTNLNSRCVRHTSHIFTLIDYMIFFLVDYVVFYCRVANCKKEISQEIL